MASLDRHTLTPRLEEHAKLPFRADCPYCREVRLRGPLPRPEIVPRRAKAGLLAGMLAASAAAPAAPALGQPPASKADGKGVVLPPGGVEADDTEKGDPPAVELGGAPEQAGPPVTGPRPEIKPPQAEVPRQVAPRSAPSEPNEPTPADQYAESPGSDSEEPSPAPAPESPRPREEHTAPPSRERATEHSAPQREPRRGSEPRRETADRAPAPGSKEGPRGDGHPGAPSAGDPGPSGGGGSSRDRSRTSVGTGAEDGAGAEAERVHVVKSGESLWAIAEERLGARASDAEIAEEVNRLWELNDTEVIRTGDPDLILPGQRLRL
jgi:LysM domain